MKSIIATLASIAVIAFTFSPGLRAAEAAPDLKAQVAKLQSEIETLKVENATLKKENQSLRQLISAGRQPGAIAPAPKTLAPAPKAQATGYWMTTSSSKRHNSSCRYYQNSNGRPCGPNDGIPCKICGG